MHQYTYILILTGVIVEGELALITSSLAAQQGLLNIYLVALTAFCGTLIVDWGFFFTGKFLGKKIFEKFPKLKSRTNKPLDWIARNPNWILFFYRYIYGFRNLTLLLMGMSNLPAKKFMFFSFFAILMWTALFSFLGYFLGDLVSHFFVYIENVAIYLITGFLCAVLVMIFVRYIVRKFL